MVSAKQQILAELMHMIVIDARNALSHRAVARRLLSKRIYEQAYHDLNFIHQIPLSILAPEYTDVDVFFINMHVRSYVQCGIHTMRSSMARLIVDFYEGVPEPLRPKVEWKLPQGIYDLANRLSGNFGFIYECANDVSVHS